MTTTALKSKNVPNRQQTPSTSATWIRRAGNINHMSFQHATMISTASTHATTSDPRKRIGKTSLAVNFNEKSLFQQRSFSTKNQIILVFMRRSFPLKSLPKSIVITTSSRIYWAPPSISQSNRRTIGATSKTLSSGKAICRWSHEAEASTLTPSSWQTPSLLWGRER